MKKFVGFEKGVNLGGWLSQCSLKKEHLETFITERDFQRLKTMGADHIRLPVDYLLIETEDGQPVDAGYAYIDHCVYWCSKYGLNMILDLHKTAGYSFSMAADCSSFWENTAYQQRFLALWDRLAARYGAYDFIAFDLLNEIVDPSVSEIWNRLAAQAVTHIRRFAKENPILIGGSRYNSIFTVKDILDPPDDHIVYSFHFYEPYIFTHQGASWEPAMPSDFRISYPLTAGAFITQADAKLGGQCSGIFRGMDDTLSGEAMLSSLFEETVSVAEQRNVPLYCGEYGVIDHADSESTLAWFRDIHAVFKRFGIGRAVWNYKNMSFGITDEHYRNVFSELIKFL